MSEKRSDKTAIQNANFEINPLADLPRTLFVTSRSERHILSYPDSKSDQSPVARFVHAFKQDMSATCYLNLSGSICFS